MGKKKKAKKYRTTVDALQHAICQIVIGVISGIVLHYMVTTNPLESPPHKADFAVSVSICG